MSGLATVLSPPYGYPRRGLVAAHDLVQDNRVLQSQTFASPFVAVRCALTGGQTDPLGGTTAYKVTPDTSTNTHYVTQNGVLPASAPVAVYSMWYKAAEETQVTLGSAVAGAGRITADLSTGTITATGLNWSSSQIVDWGGGWYQIIGDLNAGIATAFSFDLKNGTSYDGAANPGGYLVWHPYVATNDAQSVSSRYGYSTALQRGSTTGADAADGKFVDTGWKAVTDDLCLSADLTSATLAGDWSVVIPALCNGTTGTLWSIAANDATTNYHRIVYNGSGIVRIGSKAGAAAETYSSNLTVSTTAIVALTFRNIAGTLVLTNESTNTTVTLAAQAAVGTPRLALGAIGASTPSSIGDAATFAAESFHNVSLTTAEKRRAVQWWRGFLRQKGVTVS